MQVGKKRWPLAGLIQILLQRAWYVQPPVVLVIKATPGRCLQTMVTAAKPSSQRLHLRNLFASGRRYDLQPVEKGFTITTTSKLLWRYRKRTSASAVLRGQFTTIDDDITRIYMDIHIKLFYLLDVFLIPTFTASILIFVPWHPALLGAAILALYLLSWFGHRYNAALEANEMVFFVQKSLEDFVPTEILSLAAEASDVVTATREFRRAWEKFYEAHKND
jgi:hypothetical protein